MSFTEAMKFGSHLNKNKKKILQYPQPLSQSSSVSPGGCFLKVAVLFPRDSNLLSSALGKDKPRIKQFIKLLVFIKLLMTQS